MPCYFFSGTRYIRVTRGQTGSGTTDHGYPGDLSAWNWPLDPKTGKIFGVDGIDAALYSGPVDYFFSGTRYIRVTRGETGPGKPDAGYPADISAWGWPLDPKTGKTFGVEGINAALYSGPVDYFFSGTRYIRVTRGDTGPGKPDAGYPADISAWGWPVDPKTGKVFGAAGIDAALNSGPVDYFFSGTRYIRVTRGETGPGKPDAGYPADISAWDWPIDPKTGKVFGAGGINAALFSGVDNVSTGTGTGTGGETGTGTGDTTGDPTGEPTGDPTGDATEDPTGDETGDDTDDGGDPEGKHTHPKLQAEPRIGTGTGTGTGSAGARQA
nr:hypothetical protein [uncultured Lichenicoccus sp.]